MKNVLMLTMAVFIKCGLLNAQFKGSSSLLPKNLVVLTVRSTGYSLPDTLYLEEYRNFYHVQYPDTTKMAVKDVNGNYKFRVLHLLKPMYFTLFHSPGSRKEMIPLFLAEPGDSINVAVSGKPVDTSLTKIQRSKQNYNLSFTGRGVDKYKFQYDRMSFFDTVWVAKNVMTSESKFDTASYFDYSRKQLAGLLKKYHKSIKYRLRSILTLDCFVELELERMQILRMELDRRGSDTLFVDSVLRTYDLFVEKCEKQFNDSARLSSAKYPLFVIQRDLLRQNNRNASDKNWLCYVNLKKMYTGLLRDRMLLAAAAVFNRSRYNEAILEDALSAVNNDVYLQYVRTFSESNFKGRAAFNFTLPDIKGQMVKLDNFKNKVVFIDFWFNGCSACASYYRNTVSKVEEAFKSNSDVVFITINIDANKDRWLSALKQGIYTSSEIINLYAGDIGNREKVINGYKVNAFPRPFLIGKNGRIFTGDYNTLKKGPAKIIDAINTALVYNY